MKRTTIFPSRLGQFSLVAGLALGALVVQPLPRTGLGAQQPPARPAQPSGPLPATHVVQKGETLWGLAQQLLGDPLLWPEIYRLNTAVIEDPHWIFPGEELQLASLAGAATGAAPAEPRAAAEVAVTPDSGAAPAMPAAQGNITVAPAPADSVTTPTPQGPVVNPATGATIFAQQGRAHVSAGTLQLRDQQAYRAVREGEYYSAGFVLDAGEQLSAGTLLGNTATSSISRLNTTSSTMLYGTVAVTPPPGDSLKPGDVLLSFDTPRIIPGYGQVVRPTGLLKVTRVGSPGDNVIAQVVAMYQTIDGGQAVIRAQAYRSPRGVRPVRVPEDSGVHGEVIDLRQPREVVNAQDMLFINKGSADGVNLGDIFLVTRTSPEQAGVGALVQNQARIMIVYVRPHTATGLIIQLERSDIRSGSNVRQIRRMPS
jgi:hypothetical protein